MFLDIFNILGTIAFAISGALIGIQKRLDIFGVITLALTTALGGGLMRDVIIGNIPPNALRSEELVLLSIISAILVFLVHDKIQRFSTLVQLCDAVGLGAFAVAGAMVAVQYGQMGILPITLLSVLTAVGGGVLRDIFAQDIPSVFCREVYAVAALTGALVFYYAYPVLGENLAMNLCFGVTTIMRLVAMKYNMNLPRPRG